MFTPNPLLYLLGLAYGLFLFFLSFEVINKEKFVNLRKSLFFLFGLALLLRLIPTICFPFASGYDISAFKWAAETIIHNADIYYSLGARFRYAFLPTFALVLAYGINFSQKIHLSFLLIEKLPVIVFDSLIAVLICKISRNFKLGLIYAVSPIGIIIGSYLGQFDAITLFFLLLSLEIINKNLDGSFLAGVSLGLGTLFKPWSLLFLPLIWFRQTLWKKRLLLILSFLLPLVIIVVYYKTIIPSANPLVIYGCVLTYESVIGWWGISVFLKPLVVNYHKIQSYRKDFIYALPFMFYKLVVVSLIIFISKILQRQNPFWIAKFIILIVYVFSLGLSAHYFLWIFPFALLTNDSFLRMYMLLVGGYLFLFGVIGGLNYNFQPPFAPVFLNQIWVIILWVFFLLWGIKEARNSLRNYINA